MIRVLHIGLSHSLGGIETFLANISSVFDPTEFEFDYVAYGPAPALQDTFEAAGSHIYILGNRRNPFRYANELYAFMSKGYDVVHVHKNSAVDVIPFICAAHKDNLKVVSHSHNTHSNARIFGRILNSFGRGAILDTADALLACSRAAGEWLYGEHAVETGRVQVIPNGIDLKRYRFDSAKRKHIREMLGVSNRLLIGCVGRFTVQKNQRFLGDVLEELLAFGVDAGMLFLGDGPLRQDVERMFTEKGLGERAIFLGSVDNVADYLQGVDALVMPSLYEGLPIALIEAQASGLPIISSEAITNEVVASDRFKRLPVSFGSEILWAESILSFAKSSKIRCEPLNERIEI